MPGLIVIFEKRLPCTSEMRHRVRTPSSVRCKEVNTKIFGHICCLHLLGKKKTLAWCTACGNSRESLDTGAEELWSLGPLMRGVLTAIHFGSTSEGEEESLIEKASDYYLASVDTVAGPCSKDWSHCRALLSFCTSMQSPSGMRSRRDGLALQNHSH
jgi:hypothetical protein